MTFFSSSFDIAIDRATLDAMLYRSLWSPEPKVRKNEGEYVDEVKPFPSYFLYLFLARRAGRESSEWLRILCSLGDR